MTDAERLLWRHLRGHRLCGTKFKRQQPLGSYIVDFICFETRTIIEVDGGQHLESAADKQRDAWLRSQEFKVLRFWNNEVLEQIEAVLEKILEALPSSSHLLSHDGKVVKGLERIRWRCRRGLLELDIVLGRFVERHYAGLDEAGRVAFDVLLNMPDTELWDMITGRGAADTEAVQSAECGVVLKLIREA